MGRIGKGTKVWDERGPRSPTSSAFYSSRLSVRTSYLIGQVTVQSRVPGSNRSARR